jgi:putative heme-binding domain-containing protein
MLVAAKAKSGDVTKGQAVYKRVCAQCHQFKGDGYNVGPDLTSNGRSGVEQFVSNLYDPNLVIGKDYRARTAVMNDGRVVTGLLVEDSPARAVLRIAGGKQEILPRGDIETIKESAVSLMPEDLEKQVSADDLRDLIAFIFKN